MTYRIVELWTSVSCNGINARVKFYVTIIESPFILGLAFCRKLKLVTIAPVCIQQSVTLEPKRLEGGHITDKLEEDYDKLHETKKEKACSARQENR